MIPAPGDRKRVAIFTICSNNYMPFAHVLFASARRHHPDAELFLCLADRRAGIPGLYGDTWTVVEARDLPIPDFPSFAFRYDIMEFNTALKPFMFLHLLDDRGFDAVIYLDPDIELFAPLAPVLAALHDGASFFFTPHLCSPCEDRREPNDIAIMRAGAYNLGFLGVSRTEEAAELLGWWARRLRYQCVNAQADGLFVDQKFMDLVPGFAPSAVISHDTTLNVAYWNLQQRRLEHGEHGWTINDAPLIFFHFSGFNPHEPDRLSKHDPRFLGTLPEPLRELTAHYAEQLLAQGYGSFPGSPYAYGQFASGTAIHPTVRRMFREWHPLWGADPFESYEAFLHEPWPEAARNAPGEVVTNFMRFLQGANVRLGGLDLQEPEHVATLVRWFVNDAAEEFGLDPALVEPAARCLGQRRRPRARIPAKPDGGEMDVTVTAAIQSPSDAGWIGRETFHTLLAGDLAVEMLDAASPAARGNAPVQVICLEAGEFGEVLPAWVPQLRHDAFRILLPICHFARFPDAALPFVELVHEVWTPSRFIQMSLAGRTDCPVIHMPVAVELEPATPVPRDRLGLPDGEVVFFSPFDSTAMEREDPCIAVRAFRRAFPRRGAARLFLASVGIALSPGQRATLEAEVDDDPSILLLEEGLRRDELPGLLASCDVVLALHRAGGLGLCIAQAMLLRKPVIATHYAAAREFVTGQTGYPVDYRLARIESGAGAGQLWAEPDVAHAAWTMRHLAGHLQAAAPLLARAYDQVRRGHGRDHVTVMQAARLHENGLEPR
jgi:glycosyltransferase involved in cell wall biosynthesis